jgi:The Golgi pH Regulator (GPHR) Family N-terminal
VLQTSIKSFFEARELLQILQGSMLVVDVLLLAVLLAAFYKLAWVLLQEGIFPHTTLQASAQAFGARGRNALSLIAAGRLFCFTLSLSLGTLLLLVFEVTDWLNAESRALAWRALLSLMLINLHLVLPAAASYASLSRAGLPRIIAAAGAAATLALLLTVLRTLCAPLEAGTSFFSIKAGVRRVGMAGIACLALLSGFGAVSFPLQQLQALRSATVTHAQLAAAQSKLRQTLALIGSRKLSLLRDSASMTGAYVLITIMMFTSTMSIL